MPTVAWSKTADVSAASEWDISAELSKRLYLDDMFPNTFGQPLLGGMQTQLRKLTF